MSDCGVFSSIVHASWLPSCFEESAAVGHVEQGISGYRSRCCAEERP